MRKVWQFYGTYAHFGILYEAGVSGKGAFDLWVKSAFLTSRDVATNDLIRVPKHDQAALKFYAWIRDFFGICAFAKKMV